MAKKISELPAAAAVAEADELELNQSGTSRKATRAQIVAGLAAATHAHTLADLTDAGVLAAKDVIALGDIAATGTPGAGRYLESLGGALAWTIPAGGTLPGVVSVADFGATGDGSTDDYQAFVDALATGELVQVPKPDVQYNVSNTIVVPTKKGLVGVGGSYKEIKIRCTDKTKACVRLEGEVAFGNLSLGYTQTLTPSDTGAVALALSSLRRCEIGPVDVFNAGYGIQLLQQQGALESANVNTSFQTTWRHLDLRKCYVRYIDLQAFNSASTPSLFHNVRCVGFSSGTSRLTMSQGIELGVNTGISFGVLNIEHTIFSTAAIRATSGNELRIDELHMEGVSFDNAGASPIGLVVPTGMLCEIGSWKLWNSPVNPTSTTNGTIAYLARLNNAAVLRVAQLYSGGVTRQGSSDLRLLSYADAAPSSAFFEVAQASTAGITLTLNEDTSAKMGLVVRRLGDASGRGPWTPVHGAGITTIGDASLAFDRTHHGPHFRLTTALTANRALTAAQTPVAGDEITVWREAGGAFAFDVLGVATLDAANMGVRVRYDGTAWRVLSMPSGPGTLSDGSVTTVKLADAAVTAVKIANGNVTAAKLAAGSVTNAKIAAGAVGSTQLADTAVTPGVYTVATVTVDQQGRITAASSGTGGEVNTGSNIGTDGVGVFAGKLGTELRFRHIAPGSDRISVDLNGPNIEIDVVEGALQIAASNVTGLAAVATLGTLAALTSLDAGGGALTNHLAPQDSLSGNHTFVQTDAGREKVFTGTAPATWTIPALSAGTQAVVHNMGTMAISFAASGITLKGLTTLAPDKTAAVSWLPGNVVKLTGELS